ncbi:tape measure domain-containing protein [Acinetobacter wuhouensis]|nr:tape measure domain-containing protein [Acinetobacter wuhouensis]
MEVFYCLNFEVLMSKNLTFKLILDGDNKGLISAAKQSETTVKSVLETIKTEAEKIKIDALVGELAKATTEISSLGDKSAISATQLRDMSTQSQQMISGLKSELIGAQAELVRLSQTNASPADIQNAINRVEDLKSSIQTVETAFGAYESVATNAMTGVDRAASKTIAEVQKFTSVDLNNVVSEAQNATRAIESMGDGAVVSSQEIERISQLGANSISTLEKELQQATTELKNLSQSTSAVPLEKFNEASNRVVALEDALSLTQIAFKDFQTKASSAMHEVSDSTNKAADSAKKAGNDIYSALGIRPPTVINDAITDLTKKLEDFKKNSKLPAEEIARVTKITEQEISRLKNELSGVDSAAEKANSGVSTLSKGMGGARFAANALVGAMAALGVGFGVKELAQTADSYTNLSARINIATQDGGNFAQAMAGVHQVALATNSSLEATGTLFTKINDTGKQMGLTQQQSLDLTKTINQAIQTGGGSAQASEAAITQLAQALQSGVLRGDEFNSIMEQAPGLTKALASGLNVTTGELRKMAENGELSAERVVKAIQSQSAAVQADYDKFPTTIGNALQRISTSWEILIGKMDQASGTSSQVAQWLAMLADNIQNLKIFIDDIGEGFVWIGDKLQSIDPSTINVLKSTLSDAYDTVKSLISNVATLGETIWSAFTTALDSVSPLFAALLSGKEEVSGLEVALNTLRMAFAAISDIATGFNIGLKLLLSGIQFLSGGLYALSSQVLGFLGFDTLAQQALNASDRMFAQAEKNGSEAAKLAENHKWAVIETYKDISETEEQGNQESIALSKEKLNQLLADQKTEAEGKKVTEDEKLKAVQAYAEASIKANGGVMDGVMQADLLTKGYIVTIDEAGKVSVQAGESAAQAAENAKVKEEALKVAKDNVKKADEELLAYQKQATVERVLLDKQIEEAKRTGDLNALVSAQNSVNAIDAKENELRNNRNTRITELNNATTGSGKVAESAYSRASAAAKIFDVDLDASLNKVSKSFSATGGELDGFKNKLSEAGVTGKQAGDVTYQAWLKWLETAKSQAEIDAAKAKLKEFGDQGVISTSQVDQGLFAIKMQAQKLPDDIDPVTASFKRLGIETKENLALAAKQAMMDFINIRDSGKATAEGIQQAYTKAMQAAELSGDAGQIAVAKSIAATAGMITTVDEAGKTVVKSYAEMDRAAKAHASTVSNGVTSAYRRMGEVAREEALSSTEAWNKALEAQQGGIHATRKGEKTRLAFDQSGVEAELKAMGYDDKRATEIAKSILSSSKSGDGYKNASTSWLAKNGYDIIGSFAGGGGGTSNANYVREQLERYSQYSGSKSSSSLNTDSKTVKYEINTGKSSATVYGNQKTESDFDSVLRDLEAIKKSS